VPIRKEYQATFSWMITKANSKGAYTQHKTSAESLYSDPPVCDSASKVATDQLDVSDLTGPILISVFCSAIGVGLTLLKRVEREVEHVVSDVVADTELAHVLHLDILKSTRQLPTRSTDLNSDPTRPTRSGVLDDVMDDVLSGGVLDDVLSKHDVAHDDVSAAALAEKLDGQTRLLNDKLDRLLAMSAAGSPGTSPRSPIRTFEQYRETYLVDTQDV
jgi:hypothetical protein